MGRGNLGASTSLAALEPQDDSLEREREREGEKRGRREGWRVDKRRDTASHCALTGRRTSGEERKKVRNKLDLKT